MENGMMRKHARTLTAAAALALVLAGTAFAGTGGTNCDQEPRFWNYFLCRFA